MPERTLSARYAARWPKFARALGLDPAAPVAVALSGGADSVLLLHLVHAARPRPRVHAVHVDHGLRGEHGQADQAFCVELCRALGVPLTRARLELDPHGPSLEARARAARYRALAAAARRLAVRTILTGHHADDVLETLILRWLRGSDLGGLSGPKPLAPLEHDLVLVRPLCGLRRAEVRALLQQHGLGWREDETNQSPRFTRNRVRHALLPGLARALGPQAIENLHAFSGAVLALEDRLARSTAHLSWAPLRHAAASRTRATAELGGRIARTELMALPEPLRRRALWRLVVEGSALAPTRRALALVMADLGAGRCARHVLTGGWTLALRGGELVLAPPARRLAPGPVAAPLGVARQLELFAGAPADETPRALGVPGRVQLADGRVLAAEAEAASGARPPERSPLSAELDLGKLGPSRGLLVRFARPGDRFHPLGAPGSRRLTRFLADAGVPREERAHVPLVFAGDELVWVAGLRPCERLRIGPDTRERLLLTLEDVPATHAELGRPEDERASDERAPRLPFEPCGPLEAGVA